MSNIWSIMFVGIILWVVPSLLLWSITCKWLYCYCCLICICVWGSYVLLCVNMCHYMCFVSANRTFLSLYMYLEFHACIGCRHTVWFLPTVCHHFLLLPFCWCSILHFVFCVLYIECTCIYIHMFLVWYPLVFNDLLSIRPGTIVVPGSYCKCWDFIL